MLSDLLKGLIFLLIGIGGGILIFYIWGNLPDKDALKLKLIKIRSKKENNNEN